jgi:hypothetical protein
MLSYVEPKWLPYLWSLFQVVAFIVIVLLVEVGSHTCAGPTTFVLDVLLTLRV